VDARNTMLKIYDHFTMAVLNLIQPYSSTEQAPAGQVWPYLKSHLKPLRMVLILSLCVTVVAASIEVWLISYAGALIDMLAVTQGSDILHEHGLELLMAAIILLLFRPLSQLLRHAINDIGLNCNAATLVRWRAHDHLANQSVGWFQEDLTGRTAIRLVDIGNHVADIFYQWLNAMAFGLVYMVGIVLLMSDTDPRLAWPLFAWLLLYIGVMTLFIPRMVKAQQTFQSAKSALTGVVVDGFSNIDTEYTPGTIRYSPDQCLTENHSNHARRHNDGWVRGLRSVAVVLRCCVHWSYWGRCCTLFTNHDHG